MSQLISAGPSRALRSSSSLMLMLYINAGANMIVCALLLNLSDTITLILFRDTVKSICGVQGNVLPMYVCQICCDRWRSTSLSDGKYLSFFQTKRSTDRLASGKPADNVKALGMLQDKRYAGRPSLSQWLIYSVQLPVQSPEPVTVEHTHSAEASLGLRGAEIIVIWLQTALSGLTMSNLISHRFSQNMMFVCLESGFIS